MNEENKQEEAKVTKEEEQTKETDMPFETAEPTKTAEATEAAKPEEPKKEKKKALNEMVKTIKLLHPDYICMFKIGAFYHLYGRDSYIVSYLFDYKLKDLGTEMVTCGFPLDIVNKIKAKLESEKLSYMLIDCRNNYIVDEKSDCGNNNRYQNVYPLARNYVNYKSRIDNIHRNLRERISEKDFRKMLAKIEEVIDESGEV